LSLRVKAVKLLNKSRVVPSDNDRGRLYSADDVDLIEDSGIEYLTTDEAAARGFDTLGELIRERVDGPAFATIDIDVVDPAFASGTGTAMPGGLTSREILRLTRELHGVDLVDFDLVEVAPAYDPAGSTSVLAANVMFEALCAALDGEA
jgi:arginase family enzyme